MIFIILLAIFSSLAIGYPGGGTTHHGLFQDKYSFSQNIGNNPNWQAFGSVRSTASDKYVELTSDQPSQKGAIWNKLPSDMDNWEVTLSLYIGGGSGAEGLAFWYAKEPGFLGEAFGSKEKYRGFCVFFDSFDNDGSGDNPSLNIGFNDNDKEHENARDGTSVRVAHHAVNLRTTMANSLGIILWKKVKITFTSIPGDEESNVLEVSLETQYGSNIFNPVMTLRDLKVPAIGYYFGVSAQTGSITDFHRVKEIYVTGTPVVVMKPERRVVNSKEMIELKKMSHIDDYPPPNELLHIDKNEGNAEKKMMAKTFNHILLRQYAFYHATEGRFDSLKDIVLIFEGQNMGQIDSLKNEVGLVQYKMSTQQEMATLTSSGLEKVRSTLQNFVKLFDSVTSQASESDKRNQAIKLASLKQGINQNESLESTDWTFYLLSFICFVQVLFFGIWLNSALKKKASTSSSMFGRGVI